MPNQTPEQAAERLLTHYLRTVWLKAGLHWDCDNDSEVGEIVDALVAAARQTVIAHHASAPHGSCPHGPAA